MTRRKILLIEPNYKNKYPPMGLMKISTYHKLLGDEVTFFKGDLKDFILDDIFNEIVEKLEFIDSGIEWYEYKNIIKSYIKKGQKKDLEIILQISDKPLIIENLKYYKDYYKKKKYFENPKWDRVCITTLFTFYWKITVDTINFAKKLCKTQEEVKVGGIAASLVPDELEKETGIKPHKGLLDMPRVYDSDNDYIIDHMPLDYSILDEIDYVYPERSGYYGYMTRGCINKCPFCAVPKIEPKYNCFIGIKEQIKYVNDKFGEKRNLLLLDNNVLASEKFNEIIDEIKSIGFDKKTKYIPPNEYNIAIKQLKESYNDRAYIKVIIEQYKKLIEKQNSEEKEKMYQILNENKLLNKDIAKKEKILELDEYFKPYFEKYYNKNPLSRYVDFNQGIDARLVNEKNMAKLSEIPIKPLRIAFDDWKLKDTYENAIRLAARNGIMDMSNYILYNFNDTPEELYYRLELNVNLCEELHIRIYSFPMKYHPIQDPKYFRNRDYEGKHWNRKFIRAIQAILNATKGKVGKGKDFFKKAFGKNIEEFKKILYMPEAMIIYRLYFEEIGMTQEWKEEFKALSEEKQIILKKIVERNEFNNIEELTNDREILNVLKYYKIKRDDVK